MLSLILSLRQLRQPSGLTDPSRFGSRDLGPAANQHRRVLSTPMPDQMQSGDPINQAPFICKVPQNTGLLLSDLPAVRGEICERCGSFTHVWNWNTLWHSHFICGAVGGERDVHYLFQMWLQMQAMQMSRLCLRSANIPLSMTAEGIKQPRRHNLTLSEE